MLGHKSAAMTLDTYADLFPDDLDDVAAALHRAASRRALEMSTQALVTHGPSPRSVGKMWARMRS
jgi:hypothetical protein